MRSHREQSPDASHTFREIGASDSARYRYLQLSLVRPSNNSPTPLLVLHSSLREQLQEPRCRRNPDRRELGPPMSHRVIYSTNQRVDGVSRSLEVNSEY